VMEGNLLKAKKYIVGQSLVCWLKPSTKPHYLLPKLNLQ
jgi:hypothetical protein